MRTCLWKGRGTNRMGGVATVTQAALVAAERGLAPPGVAIEPCVLAYGAFPMFQVESWKEGDRTVVYQPDLDLLVTAEEEPLAFRKLGELIVDLADSIAELGPGEVTEREHRQLDFVLTRFFELMRRTMEVDQAQSSMKIRVESIKDAVAPRSRRAWSPAPRSSTHGIFAGV